MKNNIINFPYDKSNLAIECLQSSSTLAYSLVSDTSDTIKYDERANFNYRAEWD